MESESFAITVKHCILETWLPLEITLDKYIAYKHDYNYDLEIMVFRDCHLFRISI